MRAVSSAPSSASTDAADRERALRRALHARIAWRKFPAAASLTRDAALAAAWDRLNVARCDLPFLDAAAVAAALEVFGDGSERLFVGTQGGRAVAMFVLAPQGRLQWATFQPSQLPLGAWVADPSYDLDTVVAGLLKNGLGFSLALSITQVDPLMAPRGADAPQRVHADYIDTAWLDVAGPFDAYWATRGKNLRQNLRKQRNRLAAEGTRLTWRLLRDAEEMAPALARYGALESAGWKAGSGTAIHPDNAQGRFYRRLLEGAAARGEAAISEYLFDDRTVAMNLCLVRRGRWVILKTTYDESVNKAFSPASLLREEELQAFFGDGSTQRIEYFGKVMEWHTKLTESRRTVYHLTAYRWPLVRALAELRRRPAEAATPTEATSTPASPAPADATA